MSAAQAQEQEHDDGLYGLNRVMGNFQEAVNSGSLDGLDGTAISAGFAKALLAMFAELFGLSNFDVNAFFPGGNHSPNTPAASTPHDTKGPDVKQNTVEPKPSAAVSEIPQYLDPRSANGTVAEQAKQQADQVIAGIEAAKDPLGLGAPKEPENYVMMSSQKGGAAYDVRGVPSPDVSNVSAAMQNGTPVISDSFSRRADPPPENYVMRPGNEPPAPQQEQPVIGKFDFTKPAANSSYAMSA